MFRLFWSENQVKHAKQFEAITMASKKRRHGNPLVTSPSKVVLSPPPPPTSSFSLLWSAIGMRHNTVKSSLYFNRKLKKLRRQHQRQNQLVL